MLLTGHKAEIYSLRFSPSGKHLVSGSFDRNIFLWNVYGDCENYCVLKGHGNAVLEVQWFYDESKIASASADKTVALLDLELGQRIRKYTGHYSIVNSCSTPRKSSQIMISGADDGKIKVWDTRSKGCQLSFDAHFPVTSVCFLDENNRIFSAGIDNVIKVWELKTNSLIMSLEGHQDTITGLRLSPDGSYILSNSMDNTVRIWDIKPYASGESRCLKIFQGILHSFEKTLLKCAWSPDGSKISAGSSDRFVYIWNTESRNIIYKLPGHKGSVNDVDFHPFEPIIGSASSDQTIYLGEIKP
jgi:Prp8 binding protein